jgi:hypothetical protein
MHATDNSVTISLGEVTNACFVIMPFDPLFQIEYERVLRPAIESSGLQCIRGDEIYARASVIADIWLAIRQCRLVVADLTGRNPNVLYELGLAHALSKPLILLTRSESDVPFDLKALRYWFYDINDPFWGASLAETVAKAIRAILTTPALEPSLEGVATRVTVPVAATALPRAVPALSTPSVAGRWLGRWKRDGATIGHQGHLTLQQSDRVSGTLIITYEKEGVPTVTEEQLVGSISPDTRQIELVGVAYTYLVQGRASSYNLDAFSLALDATGEEMTGVFRSKRGVGAATFVRAELRTA